MVNNAALTYFPMMIYYTYLKRSLIPGFFSGLCLSVSVILFISRINDELSLPQTDCYAFEYNYGWSFYLLGLSFIVEEISAVISIKLYLMSSLNSIGDMIRTIPGLEDKLLIDVGGVNNLATNIQTMIW